MSSSKDYLEVAGVSGSQIPPSPPRRIRRRLLVHAAIAFSLGLYLTTGPYIHSLYSLLPSQDQCIQANETYPYQYSELWESVNSLYDEADFQAKAVIWLGDAVRIPTEVGHSTVQNVVN